MTFGTQVLIRLKTGFVNLISPISNLVNLLKLALMGWTSNSAATVSLAIAELGLANSIGIVTAALWKQFTAWIAAGGWLIAFPAAIFGVVKAIDLFTVSLEESQEALSKSVSGYNEVKNKVKEIGDELSVIDNKIKEIEALKITDSTELQNLKSQREELQFQLDIQKELETLRKKEVSDNAVVTMEKSLEKIKGLKEEYDLFEEGIQYLVDKQAKNPTIKREAEISEWTIKKNKFKQEILSLSETIIKEKDALDFTNPLIREMYSQIEIAASDMLDMSTSAKTATESNKELADSITEVSETISNLATDLESLQGKYDTLNNAQEQFKEHGRLSADTLKALSESFPGLIGFVNDYIAGLITEQDLLTEASRLYGLDEDNYKKMILSKLQNSEQFYSQVLKNESTLIKELANSYGIDLQNFKSLAEAKQEIEKKLVGNLADFWKQYYNSTTGQLDQGAMEDLENSPNRWAATKLWEAKNAIDALDAISLKSVDFSTQLPFSTNKSSSPSSSSSAGTRPDSPDILKLDIDRYTELDSVINEVTNSINRLKTAREDLDPESQSDEIIASLKKELELNEQLAVAYNNKAWEQKKERSDLAEFLSQNGFTVTGGFDSTNVIDNYEQTLQARYDHYNSMPFETDADKDARTLYKQETDDIEKAYKRIIDLNKSVYDSENDVTGAYAQRQKNLKAISDQLATDSKNRISDMEHELYLLEEMNGSLEDKLAILEKIKAEANAEADRLRAEGYDDTSDAVQAQQKIYMDAERDALELWRKSISDALSEIERRTARIKNQLQKDIEYYDYRIAKEQALANAMKEQFDTQNNIRDIQKDINSQLKASKVLDAYLDTDTRKLLFNEDDYNELTKALAKMDKETTQLYTQYQKDINSLNADNWYLEEAITNEYERRLAMKEKEYALAEKQLNLAKKQQELNNILAEKNVRMLVGGQWQYVANMEEVRRATEELATLEEEMAAIRIESEQQRILDGKQQHIDMLTQEQSAINNRIKMLDKETDNLRMAVEDIIDPIKTIGEITSALANVGVRQLDKAVEDLLKAMSKATGVNYGYTATNSHNGQGFDKDFDYAAEMSNHSKGSSEWERLNRERNAKIDALELDIPKYASGTKYAKGGLSITDEEALELKLSPLSNGKYVNLKEGSQVFSGAETQMLGEWAKINPVKLGITDTLKSSANFPGLKTTNNSVTNSTVCTFTGDIKTDGDAEKFMRNVLQRANNERKISRNR